MGALLMALCLFLFEKRQRFRFGERFARMLRVLPKQSYLSAGRIGGMPGKPSGANEVGSAQDRASRERLLRGALIAGKDGERHGLLIPRTACRMLVDKARTRRRVRPARNL